MDWTQQLLTLHQSLHRWLQHCSAERHVLFGSCGGPAAFRQPNTRACLCISGCADVLSTGTANTTDQERKISCWLWSFSQDVPSMPCSPWRQQRSHQTDICPSELKTDEKHRSDVWMKLNRKLNRQSCFSVWCFKENCLSGKNVFVFTHLSQKRVSDHSTDYSFTQKWQVLMEVGIIIEEKKLLGIKRLYRKKNLSSTLLKNILKNRKT